MSDDLAKQVIAYDEAIKTCGNDPEKMASFCTAEGESLDLIYFKMLHLAKQVLGIASENSVCDECGKNFENEYDLACHWYDIHGAEHVPGTKEYKAIKKDPK